MSEEPKPLRRFNRDTVGKNGMTHTTITFNIKSPCGLTKKSAEAMKLKVGDKIEIVQDPDNERNWYIISSAIGFTLRRTTTSTLAFNAMIASREIIKAVCDNPEEIRRAKFTIITNAIMVKGEKAFPIVTGNGIFTKIT